MAGRGDPAPGSVAFHSTLDKSPGPEWEPFQQVSGQPPPAAVAARRSACLRLNADYRPAPGENRPTNGVGAKRARGGLAWPSHG